MLGELCDALRGTEGEGTDAALIRNRVNGVLTDIKSAKTLAKVEQDLDREHDGIIARLRKRFRDVPEQDLRIVTYELMGLSPRAVSVLLDVSVKTYYARRSRLRDRIEKSDFPDVEKLLAILK